MIHLIKTNSDNADFQMLVSHLDEELRILDGEEHVFYASLNKTNSIVHAIVAYENEVPVGCGAIRKFSENAMEVKRMFVPKALRGKGIASKILAGLEQWARELNYSTCVLETGKRQPDAIHLYQKSGYTIIPNYGKYLNVENSVCFQKILDTK